MGLTLFILLMVVGASHSASILTNSNEIVSIPIPRNNVSTEIKERGSFVDMKPQALTSARSGLKPALQMECQSDDDCPKHQYCYDTNVCATCYECSVYFRHPSITGCAKTPQMCGACLEGYQNEILSGGKVRDTCTRITTAVPEPIFAGPSWNTPHLWIFAFFVFVGLMVTVVIIAVWCKSMGKRWAQKFFRGTGNGSYTVYSLPSAPPLPMKDCDIGRNWVEEPLVRDHEREQILNTQSVPFDTSQIPSKCCSGEHEESSHSQYYTEPDDGFQYNAAVGPSQPDMQDETTTPSTWTPQPWSEGTLITSFAGLFSQGTGNNNNNNNSTNNSSHSPSLIPQPSGAQPFTPNSSFNDSDTSSSSNSSTGSEGASPRPHTSSNGGPVHILVGGLGQSTVHCSVMVNNVQINEY